MRAGVGYSENTNTMMGGIQAATEALKDGGRSRTCDFVLVFCTVRHDPSELRRAIASVVGPDVPIIGGAAAGAISNTRFGYNGDQIVLAVFWMDGLQYGFFTEARLLDGEEEAGRRLGKQLAARGIDKNTALLLFYDAIVRTGDQVRMIMATYLLKGLEDSLGFLPNLAGAGLQGDYDASPCKQFTGKEIVQHNAMALTFPDEVKLDTVIMHGCRPATGYYTVTKADRQTILEINGEPALQFMQKLIGPAIPPEAYAFFLIFGINRGDKWGNFNEENYASRLCLAIDKERGGIVMFEPDMVEGTDFQVMIRSFDFSYMTPEINRLFSEAGSNYEPVLALYIDCAGRAGAYAGTDREDALEVQNAVAGRVPLMGIYAGVEIAPVSGHPRALDWTGVFSLISVRK